MLGKLRPLHVVKNNLQWLIRTWNAVSCSAESMQYPSLVVRLPAYAALDMTRSFASIR